MHRGHGNLNKGNDNRFTNGDKEMKRKLNEISLQDNIDDVNSVLSFCKSL